MTLLVDSEAALKFGCEGIGLCRTEHMFFEEGRIDHVRAMILAKNEYERRQALARQQKAQATLPDPSNGTTKEGEP